MNLVRVADLGEGQVQELFELADALAQGRRGQALSGRWAVLFFPDSSIRTRITFEKGIAELGGRSLLFPPSTLDKREDPEDVVRYLENWADLIVVRHPELAKIEALARHSPIPVINAMTSENHPCEILSDLYALRKLRSDYRELTYAFVGARGNILNSWAEAAKVLGLRFLHVCPDGGELGPDGANYAHVADLAEALPLSDVVLTDSLPAGLRNAEYIGKYQITLAGMRTARPGALLNPCPPFYRGEEVSRDAVESRHFVGYGFKKSLALVQQAIMLLCLDRSA